MWIERGLRPRREGTSGRGLEIAVRASARGDDGFTLLELLVVVVIVGVLTAIAVPVFSGQQESAKISATKSDLINFKTAIMSYAIARGGSFEAPPGTTYSYRPPAGLFDAYGWRGGSPSVDLWLQRGDKTTFCASALGTNDKDIWIIDQAQGPRRGYC